VQDEWVHVRPKLCYQERHAVRHEAGDEVNVAAQAVEFRHADSAAAAARFCERSSELGATVEGVSAFACLDFHELTDDLESLRGPETRKGLTLCFQAEARTPLPDSGHSVVRDDWPCHDSLEPLSRCAPVLGLRSLQLPCPRALASRGAPRLRS